MFYLSKGLEDQGDIYKLKEGCIYSFTHLNMY